MSNQSIPRIFSHEEAQRLINQTNENYYGPFRNKAILRLTLATGLRSAEVRHLKDQHVDLSTGRLVVRKEGAKNDRERTLWFPSDVSDLLSRWVEFRDQYLDSQCEWVFPTKNCNKISGSNLRRMIKRYAEKADLTEANKVNFHLVRHTALTWKYQETKDIRLIQRMAGHESITTTQRYVTIADDELEEAMKNGSAEENETEEEERSLSELIDQVDEEKLRAALKLAVS